MALALDEMSARFVTGEIKMAAEKVPAFIVSADGHVDEHEDIFDEVVSGVADVVSRMKLGPGLDLSSEMGPLISAEQRETVMGYIQSGKESGAKLITGGQALEGKGYFVQPTIFSHTNQDLKIAREEIFGPCCHIRPFDEEEEAVALANDTPYGLCCSLWTENLSRAHRVSAQMETGLTWVNCWFLRDLRTPFGGTKQSGIGREGGIHSLEFYSELRNVCVKL